MAEWGADFDAAQAATLAGLTSMDEGEAGGAFFQTDTLGAARVDFDGMAAAEQGGSGSGSEDEDDEAGGLARGRIAGAWLAALYCGAVGCVLGMPLPPLDSLTTGRMVPPRSYQGFTIPYPLLPPAAEGMSEGSSGEEGSDDEDEDAMDEGEAAPAAKRQRGAAAAAQNAQLYGEAGQFNPHAARAEKKQRKKGAALRQAWAEVEAAAAGEGGNDDYDFEADWGAEGGAGSNPFAQLGDGEGSDEE